MLNCKVIAFFASDCQYRLKAKHC